jgi:regulator of sigma E protease
VDAKPVQIGSLDPGGAADQARLKPGDVILQVNDKRADKWKYIVDDLLKAPDQPALFQIQRGPTALAATYQVEAADVKRFTMEGSLGSPLYVPLPRIVSPIKAATRGLKQTFSKIRLAYANIKQLSTGQVSTEAMAGPVGIMQFAYLIGSKGLGTSINFWAMLSVFIAVLNFLPIPPFDGGHVLFVVFDAIKGKPVSLKTRHVFWLVGWILVGLLFIFVTCQDVGRLLPEAVRRFLGL